VLVRYNSPEMYVETQLTYFEQWILRIRAPLGQPGKRILLMLHGWQGDEDSMWVFAHKFPADYWIIAPRAPHLAPQGGYSWSMPGAGARPHEIPDRLPPDGSIPPGWPTVDLLRPAAAALLDLLDTWPRAQGLDVAQVDVIGFSQGAAMTFTLALLYPARVRKMAILAGFAPGGAERVLTPGRFNGIKAFVAHGTRDENVPIVHARRNLQLLEQAGAQIVYCESNMAHKLSVDCLRALEAHLSLILI